MKNSLFALSYSQSVVACWGCLPLLLLRRGSISRLGALVLSSLVFGGLLASRPPFTFSTCGAGGFVGELWRKCDVSHDEDTCQKALFTVMSCVFLIHYCVYSSRHSSPTKNLGGKEPSNSFYDTILLLFAFYIRYRQNEGLCITAANDNLSADGSLRSRALVERRAIGPRDGNRRQQTGAILDGSSSLVDGPCCIGHGGSHSGLVGFSNARLCGTRERC